MKLPMNQPQGTQLQPPSQSQLPTPKASILNSVFIGTDGLRAGWSLVIFIALMAALLKAANVVGNRAHLLPDPAAGTKEISFGVGLFAESLPLLAIFLVTWIMSKIEKRPNSVYGLGGNRRLSQFLMGLAWGVTCLSFLVFALRTTGLLAFNGRLLFGTDVLRYGAIWVFGFLAVGLLEEYLNRGYLLFTLTRGLTGFYWWLFKTRQSKALGFWTGAIIVSLLFGLGHNTNPGESPIGLLSAGLGSLVFCLSLWRTGSLWWAIGFHTAWDWAQSFLYGVADSGLMVEHHLLATHPLGQPLVSGGTTGPEGSIFVLPLLGVISLIIIFTLPNTGYANSVFNRVERNGLLHPKGQ
jgi:membrane protease YdiL (CAAX protease family)